MRGKGRKRKLFYAKRDRMSCDWKEDLGGEKKERGEETWYYVSSTECINIWNYGCIITGF